MRRLVCLLLVGLVAGCGHSFASRHDNEEQSIIEGKITLNGKPFTAGSITLVGPDGKSSREYIRFDGSFRMNGIAPGQAKVLINGQETPPRPTQGIGMGQVPRGKKVKLPDAYLSREATPVTVTVTAGKQETTIELVVDPAELDRLNPPGAEPAEEAPPRRRTRPPGKDTAPEKGNVPAKK